jgi:hypothetical protein
VYLSGAEVISGGYLVLPYLMCYGVGIWATDMISVCCLYLGAFHVVIVL